jgi:hypothetical protein
MHISNEVYGVDWTLALPGPEYFKTSKSERLDISLLIIASVNSVKDELDNCNLMSDLFNNLGLLTIVFDSSGVKSSVFKSNGISVDKEKLSHTENVIPPVESKLPNFKNTNHYGLSLDLVWKSKFIIELCTNYTGSIGVDFSDI